MLYDHYVAKVLVAVTIASSLMVLLALPLCVSAQGTDPESVVKAVMNALNTQDMDAGLALIADDAVITLVPPPPGHTGVFTGREEIEAYWENWFAGNGYAELSNFHVEGDRATWSAKISDDEWREMGVAPLDFEAEAVVQGGLLKSWTFTKTDETIAKLAAAESASVSLPETGVPMSGGLFPTSIAAMVLGSLLGLGGAGLALPRRRARRS